jgi:G2/mitotic-specific cyclin 2
MAKKTFLDITNVVRKNIKLTVHKSCHRKKLLKWLYEVLNDFEYSQVTFATAIFIIDRYTEVRGLDLAEYQLIGIAALFLSAKIEERHCKGIEDYIHVTDNSYGRSEILEKEAEMLRIFDFNLLLKLPHAFLRPWYLEKVTDKYQLKQRQEIFFCAFSYIMEKNACGGNIRWVYLEGIREAEKVFAGCSVDLDFRFYLETNRRLRNILHSIK